MPNVMIIDDQFTSRIILEELVGTIDADLSALTFDDPRAALEWAEINQPDLVLTDYKMPGIDGAEFIRRFRDIRHCQDVPIIVITVVDDKLVRYQALESGATDVLNKPVDHHECRARCRNLLTMRRQQQIIHNRARWLEKQVAEATRKLHVREREALKRLATTTDYRAREGEAAEFRIGSYSRLIAEKLGLNADQCDVVEVAATLHDVGNVGVIDSLLLKPGGLSPEELEAIKIHTTIGHKLLADAASPYLQQGAIVALNHHERYDGTGYPNGLKGEEIPLIARIVAVADIYDALTSERPYRSAFSMDQALEHLKKQKGRALDPDCVDAFLAQFDKVAVYQHKGQALKDVD
jgi:two-component system response regulator RpfG